MSIVGVTSRKSLLSNGLTFGALCVRSSARFVWWCCVLLQLLWAGGDDAIPLCVPSPRYECFAFAIRANFPRKRFTQCVSLSFGGCCVRYTFFENVRVKSDASRSAKIVEQTRYDWIKILLHIDEGKFLFFYAWRLCICLSVDTSTHNTGWTVLVSSHACSTTIWRLCVSLRFNNGRLSYWTTEWCWCCVYFAHIRESQSVFIFLYQH